LQIHASFFVLISVLFPVMAGAASAPPTIADRLNELALVKVTDDRVERLPDSQKKLLSHLIQAAMVMDTIYLDQLDPRNHAWLDRLHQLVSFDKKRWSPYLWYFQTAYGPWDMFHGDGVLPEGTFSKAVKRAGGNFYPPDMTEKEVNDWIRRHPGDAAAIKSPYTMVRREASGRIVAIPYSAFYRDLLQEAAFHLYKAKEHTSDATLAKLLESRAEAFLTNRYNETEPAWIAAWDGEIQLTIGPYEEYEDGLLGVKRGFGARVAIKDETGTNELKKSLAMLGEFQNRLPVDAAHLKDYRKESFITAVNEIFMSGEARAGVQTLGHKLPNDREVSEKHGSRRVLFMNIIEGKCERILKPLANLVLSSEWRKEVSCDAFEKMTLHHELAHGLGPAFFYKDAKRGLGRKELQQVLGVWGSPLEEAKADIVGLYDQQYLVEKGLVSKAKERELYATYVASIFRTLRFGAESAHKKGIVTQLNLLREKGAIAFDAKGLAVIDMEKMRVHVKDVVSTMLALQTKGDPKAVEELFTKHGSIPAEMQKLLDGVSKAGLPRDLYPTFPAAQSLVRDGGVL